MKIGIDAHDLEGRPTGVGRVLINLLREWAKFKLPNDLKFILYFKKEIPDDLELSDFIFVKKLLKAPFNLQSNAFFIHYLLPRAAKKDKVDILFCPAYIAPVFYQGKIALTLHDIIYQARPDLYNWPSFWDKILLKKVSRLAAQKAEIIFTPSEFSKREVLGHYQVAADKILVTPLAADESFKQINDQDKLAEIKKKYQIKDKFIFYVGSIFNRRHLPEVIKAFGSLAPKLPNYQFLIIGANHTSPFIDIDGLIRGVNQKLGHQAILRQDYLKGQDLVALYNAADLLVWLSDYEGFGLPILEAMACATLVITSPFGSIPEVAGDAAVYIQDSKNINEISQAIEQGLFDENLRKKLIKQGLAQAKKFSWQRCARKTLDLLLGIK
ncbi:MAG: glycosyltransferase family 4 protein [Candidatus Portnoybacteria bacterium]|nr:glycosyltransferase family 4 protein [Candidatus Portnoybacteria bacterium]